MWRCVFHPLSPLGIGELIMATAKHATVVGVFESQELAQRAVSELKRRGFTESQIGVAGRNYDHDAGSRTRRLEGVDESDESYAAEGATAGLATGAGVGALWGLGIIAGVLPAIGPAIAGGTLAAMLSSAAAGAATAGLAGGLIGMGMSKDEADYYQSEFQSGRTIVTVNAAGKEAEARQVFSALGAYDMETRHDVGRTARATSPGSRDDLVGNDWADLHEADAENTSPRRSI
jgi:hypothetical protein